MWIETQYIETKSIYHKRIIKWCNPKVVTPGAGCPPLATPLPLTSLVNPKQTSTQVAQAHSLQLFFQLINCFFR